MPEETALRRTPLFDRHVEAGARIVPFAGWEMPVQYEGIIPEHLAVRTAAGVFDVSHMGQLELRGAGALAFAQRMLSNDLDRIGAGHAQYTLLLDERGCPIDDLIAYRFADDHLLLVVNASRVDDDRDWLERHLGGDVALDDRSSQTAMLALQGPTALGLIELPQLVSFGFAEAQVCGVPALVARTGYTGEPGVELMCAMERVGELWDAIIAAGKDSGMLAALHTLAALGHQDGPLSQLLAEYSRYVASGEINSEVDDQKARMAAIESSFGGRDGASIDHLDGLTVELADGSWFNVRPSNTEPLLRLNVEGADEASMTALRDEVLALIRRT